MAQRQSSSNAAPFLWVAGIAFVLGRCSVDTTPQAQLVVAAPVDGAATEKAATSSESPSPAAESTGPADIAGSGSTERQSFVSAPQPQIDDVYFQNCSAARAAGAAPIREGEPGYAPKLDRDRDGVACE
jgi:Excalibur calcium-binding domain